MGGCADNEVVVLPEIIFGGLAVNLAGGSDDNSFVIFCGEVEYASRAVDIGFDGLNGVVDNEFNADRGGEVKNGAGLGDEFFQFGHI